MPKKNIEDADEVQSPSADTRTLPPSAPELPEELARDLHEGIEEATKTRTPDSSPAQSPPVTEEADVIPEADASQGDPLLDDSDTDQAVDEIMAKESDAVLTAADASHAADVPLPLTFRQKIGAFFGRWWRNRWARWTTIIVIFVGIAAACGLPQSRYFILNNLSVRTQSTVLVQDETAGLGLKNVSVIIDNQQQYTDSDGKAKFKHLKLGKHQLTIKRLGFAPVTKTVTLGWGSNPIGPFNLHATGAQYTLQVKYWLSGKSIEGAEATADAATARSSKDGKIILTMGKEVTTDFPVTVSGKGFRSEQLTIKIDTAAVTNVALVPATKAVYISKQSGKFDLYAIDVDGKNSRLLLAGTGTENNNISVASSPDGTQAALISTRDNVRDRDGYLLSAITIVDVERQTHVVIDHAEQVKLVDWIGTRLIYHITVAGASAANSQRTRIISYDYKANSRAQLATANQFNGVMTFGGTVYYAVSNTDPAATPGLYQIKSDGTGGRQTIQQGEIWTMLRTEFNTVALQSLSGWLTYAFGGAAPTKGAAPTSSINRQYRDSPNGKQSLRADSRDGKGVLLAFDGTAQKDKTLRTQEGLSYPVRWLDDQTVVYRVVVDNEISDYALSSEGGDAHKITDVTNTYGFSQGH